MAELESVLGELCACLPLIYVLYSYGWQHVVGKTNDQPR